VLQWRRLSHLEDQSPGIFTYHFRPLLRSNRRLIIPQANPLNTYLSTKPSFTSPQPLAAASGLTIPLQITLSDIKLSAFIILVFSKQKGLTLVFRNDPLESLKVSSTFDSIPFVRDYLQKEIEGQLRTLLMDEVPAIIHRLSLRLWVPEYRARQDEELSRDARSLIIEEKVIDPLACPPADPIDLSGHILDASQITSLSLDSSSETHSLFSQKNLLRLGALTETHRTLSLSTPSIRDAVFRAWAGPTERGEHGSNLPVTPMRPHLSRGNSYIGSTSTTYVFSDASGAGCPPVRPTLSSFGSSTTGLNLGGNRHGKSHGGRKRKHRIVNLRKRARGVENDLDSVSGEGSTISETMSSAPSEFGVPFPTTLDRDGELLTPPRTPEKTGVNFDVNSSDHRLRNLTPRKALQVEQNDLTPKSLPHGNLIGGLPLRLRLEPQKSPKSVERENQPSNQYPTEKPLGSSSFSVSVAVPPTESQPSHARSFPPEVVPTGSPEHAWVMRIVGEIARRVHDEKAANSGFWQRNEREDTPPPAYGL
jgi:mitochondrial distribution and morphology protein 34